MSPTEIADEPELKQEQHLQVEGSKYLAEAKKVAGAIGNQETFQIAADFRGKGKTLLKQIEAFFKPMKQKIDAAKKELLDKEKSLSLPYAQGDELVRQAQNRYLAEEERKRSVEQERIMAEQRKRDEDARLAAAQEAASSGDHATADAIMEAPPVIQAPVNLPKASATGAVVKKVWKAQITAKSALIKAIAEGKAPEGLVEINEVELRKWAAMMGVESPCPGVRAWQEFSTGSRAA